jgi:hypothetical protein
LIAGGAVGLVVGFAIGFGSASIGGGTVEWGTIGEWVGGFGATLAVGWAVWAFHREREANERRYAEMVGVLPADWVREEDGYVRAHVSVQNNGPAPVDLLEVSGVFKGRIAFGMAADGEGLQVLLQPGERKGFILDWLYQEGDLVGAEQPEVVVVVTFLDAALKLWRRATGEPPWRIRGAAARNQPGVPP